MPRKNEKKVSAEAHQEQEQPRAPGESENDAPQREAIILHPGSSNLYVGFASDSAPQSIPHLIAYRQFQSSESRDQSDKSREEGTGSHDMPIRPRNDEECLVLEYKTEITAELESQREEGLEAVRRALADYRASLDVASCDIRPYADFNSQQKPRLRESDELSLTDLTGDPSFVIGNEVLYLPPNSGYRVWKPIKNGCLNLLPSQSLSSVRSQLEDLWTRAIEEYLDLPRKEFKNYQVVLLVPDCIDRQSLKEMTNVLFRMEFAAAILHQGSVCATYSAGLSSACVVDVGDEVTQICCVEDGMSNPNTRVSLNYGGSDITRLFHWLISQTGFPYKCRSDNCLDGVLLQQLKESICHMDATQTGVHDYQFSVMSETPGNLLDYEIKLSDEALLAPMGVFFPSSFCLPDNRHLMAGQPPLTADPEDLLDEGHWTEGQGQSLKSLGGPISTAPTGPTEVVPQATLRLQNVPPGKILSLDQAIHFSIDCASTADMKKKLYGSVLLVGGGLALPGAAAALQSRLETRVPQGCGGVVEVFANPRDLESTMVCWRGGVILRCLDTAQELWIERQEWDFYGVRLLRERAPFQW